MRMMGWSTGAIAKADYESALKTLDGEHINAVELSSLMLEEFAPMVERLVGDWRSLQLFQTGYQYVSIHLPGRFDAEQEKEVRSLAGDLTGNALVRDNFILPRWDCQMVLHPNTVHDWSSWETLQYHLLFENMDKRRGFGTTVEDMEQVFERLPHAGMCFDVGHALQIDETGGLAIEMLEAFHLRIRQVHISHVNHKGVHYAMPEWFVGRVRELAHLIPPDAAIIIESPVNKEELPKELCRVIRALRPLPTHHILGDLPC